MAESASSLTRLAAAVSHEMNTPMGALLSGMDTLLLLAARQAHGDRTEQEKLERLRAEVRESVQESAQRLEELVRRMQRFTNLDHADVQPVDLNEMLKDVAALVDPELKKKVQLELNLQPLPTIVCRPQQINHVFSNIVNNALSAVNGSGRVAISTQQSAGEVQIDIEDNGRGVLPSQLDSIFDPGFQVSGGRVAAGNWNMFSSRQMVRQHGGDIRITSDTGTGTRVTITLPVSYLEAS